MNDADRMFLTEKLVQAASLGNLVLCGELLKHGVSVDWTCDSGNAMHGIAALHSASQNGHEEIAKLLIEHGADVNARIIDSPSLTHKEIKVGSSPLHLAAWNGHEGICQILIEAGAEVGAKNAVGATPEVIASNHRRDRVADLLAAASGSTQ